MCRLISNHRGRHRERENDIATRMGGVGIPQHNYCSPSTRTINPPQILHHQKKKKHATEFDIRNASTKANICAQMLGLFKENTAKICFMNSPPTYHSYACLAVVCGSWQGFCELRMFSSENEMKLDYRIEAPS